MDSDFHPKYRKLENGATSDDHSTNNNGEDNSGNDLNRKSRAWNILRKMGWRGEGHGIGAMDQGRAEPVEESRQIGRLGLGMRPASMDISGIDIKWKPGADTADADANLRFEHSLSMEEMQKLRPLVLDKPPEPYMKPISDLDGRYVDERIIDAILKFKSRLDNYDDKVVRDARTRCNPYEALHSGQYLNRAALKLANINAMFGFIFTSEERRRGTLYFADVCAGPGGFSEYLLSQRPLTSVGYGFTLRGKDDFRKEKMLMGPAESFCCYYGALEDGNIYHEENLDSLASFVRSNSGQKNGVHLVTADGGFDVTGQENTQEILVKRLYLCQCLCALRLLQPGGDFICKLFDMVTQFSMELVLLVSFCFKNIYIVKPVTSRPANSERYLVGIDCRTEDFVTPVIAYLTAVNNYLSKQNNWESLDLVSMMPEGVLNDFPQFVDVMRRANDELGRQQALALSKLHSFIDDRNMIDDRQHELRMQCLQEWHLSAEPRPSSARSGADVPLEVGSLLTGGSPRDLLKQWRPFREGSMSNFPKYSYKAMVMASPKAPVLLYSRGNSQVYYFNTEKDMWRRTESDLEMEKARLSLPRHTIVLGQVVREFSPKGTRKQTCLHLLDALVIYGEDVRDRNLIERHEKLKRMVDVLKEPMSVPINVPQLFRPYELHTISRNLKSERIKGFPHEQEIFEQLNGNYIIPSGLWLVKITREPWIIHMSRSNLKLYYFNTANRQSQFEPPPDGLCSYSNGVDFFLTWTSSVQDHQSDRLVPWSEFFVQMNSPRTSS